MTAYILLRAQSYWTDCIGVYATLEAGQRIAGTEGAKRQGILAEGCVRIRGVAD